MLFLKMIFLKNAFAIGGRCLNAVSLMLSATFRKHSAVSKR